MLLVILVADQAEIAECKILLTLVHGRSERRNKAFEDLTALVKKHIGNKLDPEIDTLRKGLK